MGIGVNELLIVLGIIILLFGSTKIPQMMRGLGQGISEFKSGMKEPPVRDDEHDKEETKQA